MGTTCKAVNYQESTSCTGEGLDSSGCMIFDGSCDTEPNDCWDFYEIKQADSKWTLSKRGTGCKNWKNLAISISTESSSQSCGQKCLQTGGCTSFNWQQDACDDPDAGHHEDKQCLLF